MHTRRDLFAGAGAAGAVALAATGVTVANPQLDPAVERAPLIPSPPEPPTDFDIRWVQSAGENIYGVRAGDMAIVDRKPGFRQNANYISRHGHVIFAQERDGHIQLINDVVIQPTPDRDFLEVAGFRRIVDSYFLEDGRWVLFQPWIKRKAVTS